MRNKSIQTEKKDKKWRNINLPLKLAEKLERMFILDGNFSSLSRVVEYIIHEKLEEMEKEGQV